MQKKFGASLADDESRQSWQVQPPPGFIHPLEEEKQPQNCLVEEEKQPQNLPLEEEK